MLLLLALWFVNSLEYKTIAMMLLTFVWRKKLMRWCIFSRKRWGRTVAKHSWQVVMAVLVVLLWISLPRYRTGSDDRLQLYYLDDQGERISTPIGHWLFNALVPEEEIMNIGVWGARLGGDWAERLGVGGIMAEQFRNDDAQGKINNFYAPYRSLDEKGLSLVSGTTSQAFNDFGIGDKTKAVYVLRPTSYSKEKTYPVVFFCHGYLGNWKLYQGLFADLDDCLVVSCGTDGLSGIFTHDDISGLLNSIIPMLEREGYNIDQGAVHLIGLSNGGTACEVAQSSFPNRFKSITYISTGIHHTGKTRSTINLIGGGKDPSSSTMYPAYRALKKNGTNTNILWYDDESHFILVNKVSMIMSFIMHDVGAGRSDEHVSWIDGVKNFLTLFSLGNLLLMFYPFVIVCLAFVSPIYIFHLLLFAVICYYVLTAIILSLLKLVGKRIRVLRWAVKLKKRTGGISLKKCSKLFFSILKKSMSAWVKYLKRYWMLILFLWFVTISVMDCYHSINYAWSDWEGFLFHNEKDISKCLGIKGFPECHVINKSYGYGYEDATEETATFDTDNYATFIKKLSEKVGKDSLWQESYEEGAFEYHPDSLHTPANLNWLSIRFKEGERWFTICYY